MDFFSEQDKARKQTGRLVIYYLLAVLGIAILAHVVTVVAISASSKQPPAWFDPIILLATMGGTLAVVILGSLYKSTILAAHGGESIAHSLGGQQIDPATRDPQLKRVMNVVEEMAIASGMPVPPVYLMEESGINAFAAGNKPDDAVIGVTRGCIEQLTRDELQGVIAHEFSHILNGDMKINIRLIGVLHGLLMVSLIGSIMMRALWFSGRRRSKDQGVDPAMVIGLAGLALYILGWIGVLFGSLIKAAVSRQREFLADASAVQFTRNPQGIAGALRRIAGFTSKVQTPRASEASHLFIASYLGSNLSGLMATHPPIAERIKRIDPSFDGQRGSTSGSRKVPAQVTGRHTAPNKAAPQQGAANAGGIFESIGNPSAAHIAMGAAILAAMDPALREAAHEGPGAEAIVFALLLDRENQEVVNKQAQMILDAGVPAVGQELKRLFPFVGRLKAGERLPLLETALPVLGELSAKRRKEFLNLVDKLILADDKVTLQEFAIRHLLGSTLDPQKPSHRMTSTDAAVILSMVANIGAGSDAKARDKAFAVAQKAYGQSLTFAPDGKTSWRDLSDALTTCAEAPPKDRERILRAAIKAVATDGVISAEEGEIIRLVALSLGCPIPPIIADADAEGSES